MQVKSESIKPHMASATAAWKTLMSAKYFTAVFFSQFDFRAVLVVFAVELFLSFATQICL